MIGLARTKIRNARPKRAAPNQNRRGGRGIRISLAPSKGPPRSNGSKGLNGRLMWGEAYAVPKATLSALKSVSGVMSGNRGFPLIGRLAAPTCLLTFPLRIGFWKDWRKA